MSNIWRSTFNFAIARSRETAYAYHCNASQGLFLRLLFIKGEEHYVIYAYTTSDRSLRKTSRRYQSTIIIHLIHLSAPQIRRLLRLNPSIGDHFRGTCLRLLIKAIRKFYNGRAVCNFWINNCCVAKAKRMRQKLYYLLITRYEASPSSFFWNWL